MAESRTTMSTKKAKCKYYFKVFLRHLFSHVGLCGLVIGYAIIGAFTFERLEAPNEMKQRSTIRAHRQKCLKELWNITNILNVLHEDNWTLLVGTRLKQFEQEVVNSVKNEGYDGKETSSDDLQWSFSGALLYCITVITTIGYGNIAPKTDVGKVVTILYALLGIPLMLLCLTNIGDLLAQAFKFTYSHFCLLCSNRKKHHSQKQQHIAENNKMLEKVAADAASVDLCPNDEKKSVISDASSPTSSPPSNKSVTPNNSVVVIHEPTPVVIERVYSARTRSLPQNGDASDDNEERVPMYMVLSLVTGYICGGAVLFSLWEKWSFLDGAYFCFITLSTIGFGDLVPGSDILDIDSGQAKLIICCVYLILGLAIIAMSFNLVQEEVVINCKNLARNLGFLDADNDDDDD